jgi:lipoate-protein ligase B
MLLPESDDGVTRRGHCSRTKVSTVCYDQKVSSSVIPDVLPSAVPPVDSPPWPLVVRHLGLVPYEEALAEQRRLHAERVAGHIEDTLLLLQHPHVYTLGRHSDPRHILMDEAFLRARGAVVVGNERGGEVTYHGPGQLVAYPIMHLRAGERSISRLVQRMEEAILATLRRYDLEGHLVLGQPGVWVGGRKIASIGMAVRRWTVMHGMALNVNPDLAYFSYINPCGHAGLRMTSMARELADGPPMAEVAGVFASCFAAAFERLLLLPSDPPALAPTLSSSEGESASGQVHADRAHTVSDSAVERAGVRIG